MKESSPTISSNTLFHFTNKIENVLSIIEGGFKPHFCLENLNVISDESKFYDELEYAIPMVCFCDIPLSLAENHMSKYGSYGIGLSKDWGMKNNISPVLYAYKNSAITSGLMKMVITAFASEIFSGFNEIFKEDLLNNISWINRFIKPYEGILWRDEKYNEEQIRFYDEREWRYVPNLPDFTGMSKEEFLDISLRKDANRQLAEKGVLSFKPSDIKYVIVSNEDEIIPIIKKIEKMEYNRDDFLLLSSRVISAKHIRDDF